MHTICIFYNNTNGDIMANFINKLIKDFKDTPDLVIRNINNIHIIYLETVSSSDKINDYILKNLNYFVSIKKINDINKIIPSPNIKKLKKYNEIEYYLTNGFTLIFYNNEIIAIETRADINRSVSTPEIEKSLFGPKDSFVENYQVNIGLIKRRIKSKNLKIKELNIGKITTTKVGILYMNNICNIDNVNYIKNKLSKINIDGIFDTNELAQYLIENKSLFPTIMSTERPDKVSQCLLDGKIVIIMDTSCYAIITPSFFSDFINPSIDYYNKNIKFNLVKILRTICFFLTIFVPAIYVALINYNQETIPNTLLLNFTKQRLNVPFPSVIEAIIMLFICEMLREADMRFPSSYGSAMSILGALILGEAAVSAGIVSPIMIIIIAFTFITSLMFIDESMINAIRIFRFIFLVLSSIYGLYGIIISILILLIHLCSIKTLGLPYFYPIAPYNKYDFKKDFINSSIPSDIKRNKLTAKKNIIRQRNDNI